MSDITTRTEAVTAYFKTMMCVAPALCSLVCALFVLVLMRDFKNPAERALRTVSAVFFLTIGALWFAYGAFSTPPDALPGAAPLLRAALSSLTFGPVATALAVRWTLWRRVRRIDPKNSPDIKLLRITALTAIATAALFVAGIPAAFSPGGRVWNAVGAVAIPLQQLGLAYHLIRRQSTKTNRIALRFGGGNPPGGRNRWNGRFGSNDHTDPVRGGKLHGELSKQKIEEYFKLTRPYLDPGFKLTDLADAMKVNRSEISAFINSAFGINFKRYVNRWRLAEYDRLMSPLSNDPKNQYRILPMAGFTDLRHYHRALGQEKECEKQPK